jgi:hypothetical protein
LFIARWNTLHAPVHSLLHHGQSILPHGTWRCGEKGPFPSHRGFF